jgi:hypothetical protein
VWAATCLYRKDPLGGKSAILYEELLILTGKNIIGDGS